MKKNDVIHGFRLKDDSPVPEYHSRGLWFVHEETGMEVYHLYNDDVENMFCYAFKTLPTDSTGVAHILEHSVLCGSERYPIRDPFMILSKQSVKTFLNAMTYPDKTLYPASSFIEADYFNLFDVYGDAVFFPLLDERMFRQEGHRLVYGDDGRLSVQGVVYNEMKGVYSSHDTIAGDASLASVTRGSLYELDSGGNPRDIPSLTYEQYKEFHRVHYHPSNCRLFLYGNIPSEKQLAFLEERFLSKFRDVPVPPPVPDIEPVAPISGPVFERVMAPSEGATGSSLLYTWLLKPATPEFQTEMSFLSDLLLGNDGSPLYKALIDSGMGEDLSPLSGLQTNLRQMVFSCGLRGVPDTISAEQFESFVHEALVRIASDGFDPDLVESTLLSMEIASREIVRGYGPYSITLAQRSLTGWLHGLHPAATMCNTERYAHIRSLLKKNPQHFTDVLRSCFIDNRHCSVVTAYPDPEYSNRFELEEQKKLELLESTMTEEQKEHIRTAEADLVRFQNAEEDQALIERIPSIAVADLPDKLEPLPIATDSCGSIPMYIVTQPTNGVFYCNVCFPVDTLTAEWYPLLSLYADLLTSCGFNGLTWDKAAILAGCHTGSLSASALCMESVSGSTETPLVGRDWLFVKIKTIPEEVDRAVPLVFDLLRTISFRDTERVREILAESLNTSKSAIIPSGHRFALARTSRTFSRDAALTELFGGIDQYRYLQNLSELSDSELIHKLETLHQLVLSAGVMMSLCGDTDSLRVAEPICRRCLSECGYQPPQPRNPQRFTGYAATSVRAESFTAPMQIGFSSVSIKGARYGIDNCGPELLLSHILSNGSLWNRLRMQGGAYGCSAYSDNNDGIFSCITFRDPTPSRSPDIFRECLEDAARNPVSRSELDKCITGLFSNVFPIRTPLGKAQTALAYALTGDSVALRERRVQSVLSVTPKQIQDAAKRLLAVYDDRIMCIIANQQESEAFCSSCNIEPVNIFINE